MTDGYTYIPSNQTSKKMVVPIGTNMSLSKCSAWLDLVSKALNLPSTVVEQHNVADLWFKTWEMGSAPVMLLMEEIRLNSWGWSFIPLFTGFYTSQVVQDFWTINSVITQAKCFKSSDPYPACDPLHQKPGSPQSLRWSAETFATPNAFTRKAHRKSSKLFWS